MRRITTFLFHCIVSLVAKRQYSASARVSKAKTLLVVFYVFVSFDLLLTTEKLLGLTVIHGQRIFLLLLVLWVVVSRLLQVCYFQPHLTQADPGQYHQQTGKRRVGYALLAVLAFALTGSFPFWGIH